MSASKLNVAFIRDCPPLLTLKVALEVLGRPSDKDYGVLVVHDVMDGRLNFEFFTTRTTKLARVDKQTGTLTQPAVTKDEVFKCCVRNLSPDGVGVLEVYSGSVKSIDKVKELFAMLELADTAPEIEFIAQDIIKKIGDIKEREDVKNVQILSAKVKQYKDGVDEKIVGTYTVKFPKDLAYENILAFLKDHAENVESVRLKFKPTNFAKPLTLTLRLSAFFTYSANEADETRALYFCRELAGVKGVRTATEFVPDNLHISAETAKAIAAAEPATLSAGDT